MKLIRRASCGDLVGVRRLIKRGVRVNTKNRCNQTALYFACQKGHINIVEYLLDNGASVNLGAKPLIAAVRNDHYECAELLLQHHATVHCSNAKGQTPMSVALQKRHYSMILLLLQYTVIPPASLGVRDVAVQLLKHAQVEHANVVQKLMDQKVINLTSKDIFLAAFGFAFKCGSVELAKRMLSDHNYSKMDRLPPDAVYYGAKNNWPTILSNIFEKRVNINALTDGQTPLCAAYEEGHETVVTLLLNNGADPNVVDKTGASPLYLACERGKTKIAKLLLSCGASPNVKATDKHGTKLDGISGVKAPLIVACRNKNVSLVQLLLSNGSTPDILEAKEDKYVQYRPVLPLHIAAADGSSKIVDLLLKHGSNVDITDARGNTALHYGIEHYHPGATATRYSDAINGTINAKSVVDILLENGADVNILNNSGETPLYTAVSRGLLDVVSKMLETYGANPNMSSPDKNALVVACEKRNVELVDVLLKNGADPNPASVSHQFSYSERRLPLHVAVKQGNSDEIITLLIKAGANVNATDQGGKTALCNLYPFTDQPIKLSTIRLLVEHGADLYVLMQDDRSLLYFVVDKIAATKGRACQTHFIELLQLMVKHGAILSDSFFNLAQDASHHTQRVLKDLATFDGRHEFIVDLFRAGAGLQLLAKCCNSVATRPGEVTSIRLCQAAILSGYAPSVAELQSLQLAAAREHAEGGLLSQLVNWLNEDTQRVPSLLRQCRVVIRRQLSTAVQHRSILTAINKLPLPSIVKMYLLLKER